MGNWKKVLAKCFFLWLPYAAKQAQKIRNLFSCHSLAINWIAFNLIRIRFRFECWHDSWMIPFWSWHGFWIFRMILNYQQHSPASCGREVANLILKITGSDFAQMFLKDFFSLWNARRAAWDAVPWACKENKCVGEKLFFTIFLGDSRGCANLFSANGNDSRMLKTQIENTIKWPLSQWNQNPLVSVSFQSMAKPSRLALLPFAVTPAFLVSKSNARNAAHSIQSANWTRAGTAKPASMLKSYPLPIIFEPVPLRTKLK